MRCQSTVSHVNVMIIFHLLHPSSSPATFATITRLVSVTLRSVDDCGGHTGTRQFIYITQFANVEVLYMGVVGFPWRSPSEAQALAVIYQGTLLFCKKGSTACLFVAEKS